MRDLRIHFSSYYWFDTSLRKRNAVQKAEGVIKSHITTKSHTSAFLRLKCFGALKRSYRDRIIDLSVKMIRKIERYHSFHMKSMGY